MISGNQFTRIGAAISGVAKKLVILAKSAFVIMQSTFGVTGPIDTFGKGVSGEILSTGKGVTGLMSSTFAVAGSIDTFGKGVSGTINPDGQGVNGEIQD